MINASRVPDSPPSSLGGAGFTGAASPFSTIEDCSGFAESGVSDVLTAIFVDEQVFPRRFARRVENGEQIGVLLIRYFWTAQKMEQTRRAYIFYMKVNISFFSDPGRVRWFATLSGAGGSFGAETTVGDLLVRRSTGGGSFGTEGLCPRSA